MRGRQMRQGIIIGVLVVTALWLGSLIWGLAGKAHVAIQEARTVQAAYKTIEERRQMLEASISALTTERGKDSAIRTAFGVARPGEEVVVVVPTPDATTTVQESWWQWLLSWF